MSRRTDIATPPPPPDEQILAIMSALTLTPVPQLRVSYTRSPQGWVCAVSKLGMPDYRYAMGVDQPIAAAALLQLLLVDVRRNHAKLGEIIAWVDNHGGAGEVPVIDAEFEPEEPLSSRPPPRGRARS